MAFDQLDDYKTSVGALNKEHYDEVIATKGSRDLVDEAELPPREGDAYFAKAGQVLRVEQRHETTQIADVLFVTPDVKQIAETGNTGLFDGPNPTVYHRVWSQSRYQQPLATMVADEAPEDFTKDGFRPHFWGPHCCAEWQETAYGDGIKVNSCHWNFIQGFNRIPAVQAIEDVERAKEVVEWLSDRWDVNIFQPNKYIQDESGNTQGYLASAPPVPHGTGVEWYAEKDIYVVISNCPVGDQSSPTPEATCVPLYISVHETGIEPLECHTFQDWERAFYERVGRGEIDISRRDPDSFT